MKKYIQKIIDFLEEHDLEISEMIKAGVIWVTLAIILYVLCLGLVSLFI